jgi:radical SAM superfamily enzyme
MYADKPFKVLSCEEYIALVTDIIERMPPNVSVHRITGDGSKELLIEPKWSLNKRRVLNGVHQEFIKRNTYQGYYQTNH